MKDKEFYIEKYKSGYTIWRRSTNQNTGYVMDLDTAEQECAALNAGAFDWEDVIGTRISTASLSLVY